MGFASCALIGCTSHANCFDGRMFLQLRRLNALRPAQAHVQKLPNAAILRNCCARA
jgi:hypothetical protein